MSGYISEFFGYSSSDVSDIALSAAQCKKCPILGTRCTKILSRDSIPSGACAIQQSGPNAPRVICCPVRLYANDYELLRIIVSKAFGADCNLKLYAGRAAVRKARQEHGAIAVFGHGWGGELHLPQRFGSGSYFVDWILAKLDSNGQLEEFTAMEVQTIDTTGNYRESRKALLKNRQVVKSTVGLNWENVSKRIIPQLIFKGQVLQREQLCKTGLFFVSPKAVYDRILNRLGGIARMPVFPSQPASIHFIAYDYETGIQPVPGELIPLTIQAEHNTTVYKVQEAFSAVNLPEENVYRRAIEESLYGNRETL